ncbi:hypothetical protein [Micromonospora sp. NBC_01813]|uniref:hypothetical protein n=1 Tax=Micromonospora sp. NBC_01813 TaxID=2975988 RepID=UPI002DD91E04|nr:hypothetical protein [Micromonospora sp. NBC_01813]WSA09004.1 hypothetical protein OG958_33430 [Micromonospora sp. NBC_01813]
MRDDPTPDAQRLANHAAAIRAAAVELLARVHEWRNSPHWQDTPTNQHRYRTTVDACAALDALPDPTSTDHLTAIATTIRPASRVWFPSRPGSEQSIHVAAERLQTLVDSFEGND